MLGHCGKGLIFVQLDAIFDTPNTYSSVRLNLHDTIDVNPSKRKRLLFSYRYGSH